MKSCAAGRRTPKWPSIGLWLVGAILLASKARANTQRLNWIIEQLAAPPLPMISEKAGFQASANVVNFSDAVSTQASFLYDTKIVDIGAKYSGRFYTILTDEGKSLKEENLIYRKTLAAQIGRSYLTRDNHFARLSAEYIQFNPAVYKLLRIGANTGILDSPEIPWILRINFQIFLPLGRSVYPSGHAAYNGIEDGKIFHLSAEIGQKISAGKATLLKLGGMMEWTYRTREYNEDASRAGPHPRRSPFQYEHMLFSLGPWLEYGNSSNLLRLSVPFRIYLDKEVFMRPTPSPTDLNATTPTVRYPSVMNPPDVSLAWVLYL